MKHILLLFVAAIISINATAQNVDSLETKVSHVDSLNAKIEKLQHDLDFLSCKYELNKIVTDLSIGKDEVNSNSNAILINCYHSRYDRKLYRAYQEYLYSRRRWYDSIKDQIESTITFVTLKMISSDFSEMEKDCLAQSINVIDKAKSSFEQSLDYYETILDIYRDL
jgi:hypothetical protein